MNCNDNNNIENENDVIVLSKNKVFDSKRISLICAAGLLCILIIFLGLFFGLKEVSVDDFIDKPNIRYCTVEDYYVIPVDQSIKQYSISNNLDLLYFDIYEKTEYFGDVHYKLNETGEVICLYEEFYDDNFALVSIYITDNRTECDITSGFNNICKSDAEINSVNIKWGMSNALAYAMFEYNGYKYYLDVDEIQIENYILTLVETLLS